EAGNGSRRRSHWWRREAQYVAPRRNIPLPAERDDGDAAVHEEGVTVIVGRKRRCGGIPPEIEHESRDAAAIDDIDHRQVRRRGRVFGARITHSMTRVTCAL